CFEAVFEFKVFFKMGSTLGFVGIGTQFFGQPLNDLMVPLHSCQQLVVFRCTAFGDLAHGDVFMDWKLLLSIKLRNYGHSWIGFNVDLMVLSTYLNKKARWLPSGFLEHAIDVLILSLLVSFLLELFAGYDGQFHTPVGCFSGG